MRRAVDAFTSVLNVLAGLSIVALLLMTTYEVTSRELRGVSWAGLAEYTEVMLVALFYLSVAAALRSESHVEVDSVYRFLPVRFRVWLEAAASLLVLLFLAVLTWLTAERAVESVIAREVRMGFAEVPVWPARMIIPIGLFALVLQQAFRLHDRWRVGQQGDEASGSDHPPDAGASNP